MKRRRNVRRRNGTAPSCPAPSRRRRNGGAKMSLPPVLGIGLLRKVFDKIRITEERVIQALGLVRISRNQNFFEISIYNFKITIFQKVSEIFFFHKKICSQKRMLKKMQQIWSKKSFLLQICWFFSS